MPKVCEKCGWPPADDDETGLVDGVCESCRLATIYGAEDDDEEYARRLDEGFQMLSDWAYEVRGRFK